MPRVEIRVRIDRPLCRAGRWREVDRPDVRVRNDERVLDGASLDLGNANEPRDERIAACPRPDRHVPRLVAIGRRAHPRTGQIDVGADAAGPGAGVVGRAPHAPFEVRAPIDDEHVVVALGIGSCVGRHREQRHGVVAVVAREAHPADVAVHLDLRARSVSLVQGDRVAVDVDADERTVGRARLQILDERGAVGLELGTCPESACSRGCRR